MKIKLALLFNWQSKAKDLLSWLWGRDRQGKEENFMWNQQMTEMMN